METSLITIRIRNKMFGKNEMLLVLSKPLLGSATDRGVCWVEMRNLTMSQIYCLPCLRNQILYKCQNRIKTTMTMTTGAMRFLCLRVPTANPTPVMKMTMTQSLVSVPFWTTVLKQPWRKTLQNLGIQIPKTNPWQACRSSRQA